MLGLQVVLLGRPARAARPRPAGTEAGLGLFGAWGCCCSGPGAVVRGLGSGAVVVRGLGLLWAIRGRLPTADLYSSSLRF